jgi:hypothetical protein
LLAQQVAEEKLGRSLTPQEFTELLKVSGQRIVDGDDEQDNILNTGLMFPRVDVVALGEAILALRPEPACNQWEEHPGRGWKQALEHRAATGDRHAQGPFFQPRSSQRDHEDHPRADWDSLGDDTAGAMLLAQGYTRKLWVKDFVNTSLVSLDEDVREDIAIVLPVTALI